jgi:hypothetical protein
MKRIVLLALIISFLTSLGYGQSLTQTIRGKIVDADSKYPLPGATIILLNSDPQKGTTTNVDGTFELTEVPVGRQDIQVSFMGYETKTLNNLIVKSGKELVLNIELQENVQELEEVVIKANRKDRPNNDMAKVSARSFTIEETEKYAGSWGDPSRMAQNFAGVISGGDQRNDIIIRGNPPIGLLWRLEGINIPNPNHFGALGATGGPISILNNNVLANSDFFTGAFPAEYGNALSGVFDLEMRNGNSNQYEFTGQTGFNGFELGVEGPFSDSSNASFLANYRYSTLALFNALNIDLQVGAVPEYQDLSYKISIPLENGNLSFFGIGGLSHIVLGEERDTTTSSFSAPRGYETKNGSDMGVMGLSYLHFFDQNTRLKNSFTISGHQVSTTIDSVYKNKANKLYYHENNSEWKLGWYSKFVKKIDSKNRFDAGVNLENFSISYIDSVHESWTNTELPPGEGGFIKQLDVNKNNLMLAQAYSQWQHRFTNNLVFYAGLNFQYFGLNSSWSLEPRANIEWKLSTKQSLSIGYGYHSQLPPKFLYFVETRVGEGKYIQTNREMNFSKSNQLVLSYNHSFNPNLRLKAETYYQLNHDLPIESKESYFSLANYGASFHQQRVDSLVNGGKSRNYGIELTLEKFFDKNYYFLLTTSLFESKYKPSKGGYRNTAFNGNYVVNLLGGYEIPLGNQNTLSINLRMVSAGGKRYTPIDLEESREENYTVYKEDQAYEKQLDDYFRLDGRISLKINKKNTTQEWALDITNLTDHQNVFSRNYDVQAESIVTEYQQRFFPMMFYRINF